MKPCRNKNYAGQPTGQPAPTAATIQNAAVNRYSHPIRTRNTARSGSTEELLSYILETLSHQGDLLEELLRRTGPSGPDTM